MDATNAQRRDELKALIDQRFRGAVSYRAYRRLKDAVGNHQEQPFEVPDPWLQFSPIDAGKRRKNMSNIRAMIRTLDPNFELQHRHAVAIMMAHPDMLGSLGLLSHGRPPKLLLDTLDTVYKFQRHFLQQNAPEEGEGNSGDVQQADGQADSSSTTRKSRSKGEREECYQYDGGMCIVTKTAHPHVCHIVPFSFNSSQANAEKTKSYIDAIGVMFGQRFQDRWMGVIANPHPHGRGYSDKHWNMLCLSPQLHDWWSRGYFAFKFIKSVQYELNAMIVLEFEWMPITTFSYHDRKGVTAHWDGIQDALRHHHATQADDPTTPSPFPGDHRQRAPGLVKAFLDNGEPLATGHRLIVWRSQEVVGAFRAMIDLQYAAIKMLALCGGAGNPDLLGKDDDDDDVAGASVSSFNAFVQTANSTEEPDVQLDGLRI